MYVDGVPNNCSICGELEYYAKDTSIGHICRGCIEKILELKEEKNDVNVRENGSV